VRRAFLCGIDRLTGRSFEHRRAKIEHRLLELAEIFAIDIAAYAIMSNHYHLVLRVNMEDVQGWSDEQVVDRWARLFRLPEIVQSARRGADLNAAGRTQVAELVSVYRERLHSISWFMKCLNTDIARAANKEDECTGRFFEGRFKCQALLDTAALLKCMAYVDLNPVRANLAASPEAASHTSMAHRLSGRSAVLLPFADQIPMARTTLTNPRPFHAAPIIPFAFSDYREVVGWTARSHHRRPSARTRSLLVANNLNVGSWLDSVRGSHLSKPCVLGAAKHIREFATAVGRRWMWGVGACA
jgi:hypothetical protein